MTLDMLSMDELNDDEDPDYYPPDHPVEDDVMSDDGKTSSYSGYSSGAEAGDEGMDGSDY